MKDKKSELTEAAVKEQPTASVAEMKKRRARRRKLSTGKIIAISIILVIYVLILVAVSLVVFYKPKVNTTPKTYVEYITERNSITLAYARY